MFCGVSEHICEGSDFYMEIKETRAINEKVLQIKNGSSL